MGCAAQAEWKRRKSAKNKAKVGAEPAQGTLRDPYNREMEEALVLDFRKRLLRFEQASLVCCEGKKYWMVVQ